MTIYVDNSFISAKVKQHNSRWCHMFSDNKDPEELHVFAEKLGLRRSYFQHKENQDWQDHYDVTEGVRAKAVRLGATEVDLHESVEIWMSKR